MADKKTETKKYTTVHIVWLDKVQYKNGVELELTEEVALPLIKTGAITSIRSPNQTEAQVAQATKA